MRDTRSLPQKIREQILDILERGDYRAGDQIPTEHELTERLQVSRSTLREALKTLEEERVLLCKHGRGRFLAVDSSAILESVTRLQSVTEMLKERSLEPQSRVLALEKGPAGERIAKKLRIDPAERVIFLERVRLAEGEPLIYSLDIIPHALTSGPLKKRTFRGSLLKFAEEHWDMYIDYAQTTIRAAQLDPALSETLGLPADLPWIMLEQIHYTEYHKPVLYSEDYHRGDKFSFHVVRRRD
jgi:GntR family transcriptional regulator